MLATAPIAPMLPVASLERARRFYEDQLGLLPVEELSGGDALMFECGEGTLLGIYQRAAPNRADHTAAIWIVDDVQDTVRRLTGNGIRFEQYDMPGLQTDDLGIADLGNEWAAWFKDPDGNTLGIVQFV